MSAWRHRPAPHLPLQSNREPSSSSHPTFRFTDSEFFSHNNNIEKIAQKVSTDADPIPTVPFLFPNRAPKNFKIKFRIEWKYFIRYFFFFDYILLCNTLKLFFACSKLLYVIFYRQITSYITNNIGFDYQMLKFDDILWYIYNILMFKLLFNQIYIEI